MQKKGICGGWLLVLVAAGLALNYLTGCSGLEIGTKAWIARVDEHQEGTKTNREPLPLKCYFMDCHATEAQGS